jgi:hypothetical protein
VATQPNDTQTANHAHDYVVADISLAAYGRKEIEIAETEMPGPDGAALRVSASPSRSRARASPVRCT